MHPPQAHGPACADAAVEQHAAPAPFWVGVTVACQCTSSASHMCPPHTCMVVGVACQHSGRAHDAHMMHGTAAPHPSRQAFNWHAARPACSTHLLGPVAYCYAFCPCARCQLCRSLVDVRMVLCHAIGAHAHFFNDNACMRIPSICSLCACAGPPSVRCRLFPADPG